MHLRRALLVALSVAAPPMAHGAVRRIVHFSDVHLNLSTTSVEAPEDPLALRPRYGSDAPLSLLTSALKYASRVVPQPDILLYTGDHVTHGDNFTSAYIRRVVESNVRMLETYFPADPVTHKPHHITAITGNADNNVSYAMDVTEPELTATNAALSVVAPVWATSLSAADYDRFERRGYLQYDIDDKLTVLTLNTVPYSPAHYPDTSHLQDPFGQFAWLNATLQSLRAASRVAFVAGHIPPIVDSNRTNVMWHDHYIQSYQSIVREYRDVIKAQLFGHVHSLEVRIPPTELDSGTPMPPLFTSGSLSPKYGNDPSFLVWEYDAETYELLDYTVHSATWADATPFEWAPLLHARSSYSLASLSTPELSKLRARMETDGSSRLSDYYWNMKARSFNLPPCEDLACRARTLCTLTWWTTQAAFNACVESTKFHHLRSVADTALSAPLLSLSQTLVAVLALVVVYGVVWTIVWGIRSRRRVVHALPFSVLGSGNPTKRPSKRLWVVPLVDDKGDS